MLDPGLIDITKLQLAPKLAPKNEKPCKSNDYRVFGGELGIRTPGPVTVNSFQDCRNRPLCQLSKKNISIFQWCKYKTLLYNDQIFSVKIFQNIHYQREKFSFSLHLVLNKLLPNPILR